jgi:dihydroorotase
MRTLVKHGRVIDPGLGIDEVLDVIVNGTKIEGVGVNIPVPKGEVHVLDASDCIVAPGLIDIHTHLREPGFEYKETIATGTMAAVKGGFTSVVCMANTSPVNDNRSVTEAIVEKARSEGLCRVFPCGAITKGLKGEELAEIGDMFRAGIVAVSDDGKSVKNPELLRKALEYVKLFDIPVVSHCEDPDLAKGYVHEGSASLLSGLLAVPSIAEEIIVARDMAIAAYVGSPVHVTHISTGGSVALIGEWKRRYSKITCDTCPHYFSLTDEATLTFDTNTRVNPPLRGAADVEAIKEGLKNGIIDIIATDHAPHDLTSKDVEYDLASPGISGLETALALSLRLVHEGVVSLPDLLAKLTVNPARLLKLPYGGLSQGKPADLIVFDPGRSWTVDPAKFVSKGRNTPFAGWKLRGKNLLTMVNGTVVYRDKGFAA